MTGSVTRPAKGYPLLVVKVARVVCSFILTAVPAGRDRFVCANPVNANRVVYASTASFRIVGPPNLMNFNLLGLTGPASLSQLPCRVEHLRDGSAIRDCSRRQIGP